MATYNIQIGKLCQALRLGEVSANPRELTGGLLHKMLAVETSAGKYAVKAINPQIAARPGALGFYIDSERVSRVAGRNINAVSAIESGGNQLQELDGQYYLVFPWCDGSNIYGEDITTRHCEIMGGALAKIHRTDFYALGLVDTYSADNPIPDWNFYLQKGIETGQPWVETVRENVKRLYTYSEGVTAAAKILSQKGVISHGDLEPKNTLWLGETPYIIDWESAGFVNPWHDLVETAVYWSKDNSSGLVKERFLAFVRGYRNIVHTLPDDWDAVLDKGFANILGWLEYSFKRSLWIECADEEDNTTGTQHVTGTIKNINKYAREKGLLAAWLTEL